MLIVDLEDVLLLLVLVIIIMKSTCYDLIERYNFSDEDIELQRSTPTVIGLRIFHRGLRAYSELIYTCYIGRVSASLGLNFVLISHSQS